MKAVLAVLLLLFQLQPVFGSVACLGLSETAAQDCSMPEHGQAATASIVAAAARAAQGCELASICTPAPLAVPGFSGSLETTVPPLGTTGPLAATLPLGIPPAPPFHPPRA